MNVFKLNLFYRVSFIILAFLPIFTLALVIQRGEGKLVAALMASVCVIFGIVAVYSATVRVIINNGVIAKKDILRKKEIAFADIVEVTSFALMGRQIFLLITNNDFITISTTLDRFFELKDIVRQNVPTTIPNAMQDYSDDMIKSRALKGKALMILLALLLLALPIKILFL